MTKRLNIIVSDQLHKNLRVALAEDGIDFSTLCRAWIEDYIMTHSRKQGKKGTGRKPRKGKEG